MHFCLVKTYKKIQFFKDFHPSWKKSSLILRDQKRGNDFELFFQILRGLKEENLFCLDISLEKFDSSNITVDPLELK